VKRQGFEGLEKSHLLTLEIYRATAEFPRDALYGPISQMRPSCASIPTNIAEGSGGHGNAELARFLQISLGSASELEYHRLLARDLGLLDDPEHERLTGEVTEVKRISRPSSEALEVLPTSKM